MEIYYEFHPFVEFWNMWHKKFKENIFMEIDFTSLSCLKNQRNQNWICQLLRLSRAQHTQVSEKKNWSKVFGISRDKTIIMPISCSFCKTPGDMGYFCYTKPSLLAKMSRFCRVDYISYGMTDGLFNDEFDIILANWNNIRSINRLTSLKITKFLISWCRKMQEVLW